MTNLDEEETLTAADVYAMNKKELVALVEENELPVENYEDLKVQDLKTAIFKVLELEAPVEAPKVEKPKTNGIVYTYIGKGAESPRIVNLMGLQKFVRGQATEVTHPALLEKLPGITTFVEGEADQETLHKIDEEGSAAEKEQRELDRQAEKNYLNNLRKLKEAR